METSLEKGFQSSGIYVQFLAQDYCCLLIVFLLWSVGDSQVLHSPFLSLGLWLETLKDCKLNMFIFLIQSLDHFPEDSSFLIFLLQLCFFNTCIVYILLI